MLKGHQAGTEAVIGIAVSKDSGFQLMTSSCFAAVPGLLVHSFQPQTAVGVGPPSLTESVSSRMGQGAEGVRNNTSVSYSPLETTGCHMGSPGVPIRKHVIAISGCLSPQ